MNPYLQQLQDRLKPTLSDIETTTNADASVLLAITNEAEPKLLLTRRASHLNAHAGEVSFAGGKHETEDNNNIDTALRESYEETGLLPSQVQVIGQLAEQSSKFGLSVRPIVAMIPPNYQLTPLDEEIDRIFWVSLAWLIEQPTEDYHISTCIKGETIHLKTPSWQIDNEVIWGLTGRIIANLLEVAFDREVDWYYQKYTPQKHTS